MGACRAGAAVLLDRKECSRVEIALIFRVCGCASKRSANHKTGKIAPYCTEADVVHDLVSDNLVEKTRVEVICRIGRIQLDHTDGGEIGISRSTGADRRRARLT